MNKAQLPTHNSGSHYSIIIVFFCFLIVYACSLSFVYIEGDDAASISYHALGRKASIQGPYAPYHGMMDVFLNILPPDETILRVTAIALTSLASVCFVILVLALVFDWLGTKSRHLLVAAPIVVLLASPEFFYFGLVYNPSVFAMCLVLSAHLLVRRSTKTRRLGGPSNKQEKLLFLLSLVLFSMGVACRWNIGLYAFVIIADILFDEDISKNSINTNRTKIALGCLWSVLGLFGVFLAIKISGYDIFDIFEKTPLLRTGRLEPLYLRNLPLTMGRAQPLFTPVFLVLSILGYVALLRDRRHLALMATTGILSVAIFIPGAVPKLLMPAIPGMVLCLVKGYEIMWFSIRSKRLALASKLILIFLLVGPWLFGIRFYSKATQWGPGFEIRRSNATSDSGSTREQKKISVEYFGLENVTLTLGAGSAVPTQEGPRPLGGHFAVLLGGGWRSLTKKVEEERLAAIKKAIYHKLPILQNARHNYITVYLCQMGFMVRDPLKIYDGRNIEVLTFYNNHGDHLKFLRLKELPVLFESEVLEKIYLITKSKRFVFHSAYTSTIRTLWKYTPEAFQPLGAFYGILDISLFQKSGRYLGNPPSRSSRDIF